MLPPISLHKVRAPLCWSGSWDTLRALSMRMAVRGEDGERTERESMRMCVTKWAKTRERHSLMDNPYSFYLSFRHVVVWLEDVKIRFLPMEERGPLRATEAADWTAALREVLNVCVMLS